MTYRASEQRYESMRYNRTGQCPQKATSGVTMGVSQP